MGFIEKHKTPFFFIPMFVGLLFIIDALSALGYKLGWVQWDSWDQFYFRNQPTVFFYPDWTPGIPIFGVLGVLLVGFAIWVRKRFKL